MSDQPPQRPWVDSEPLAPASAPQPVAPSAWGQPAAVQPAASPLLKIERLANISLALSIASVVCGGIVFAVIAYVLASRAQRMARPLGKTSSDGRIRAAKIIAIIATVLWALILLIYIGAASSQS